MDCTEDSLRKALTDRQATINTWGNTFRTLKANRAPKPEIVATITAFNDLKIDKASIEKQFQAAVSGVLTRETFHQGVVNTLEHCLFYIPSFKIYRGVAGLYEYGLPGCVVKSKSWRSGVTLVVDLS